MLERCCIQPVLVRLKVVHPIDMKLEASNFIGKASNLENTESIAEDEEMETESVLHDDKSIDTLSNAEKIM